MHLPGVAPALSEFNICSHNNAISQEQGLIFQVEDWMHISVDYQFNVAFAFWWLRGNIKRLLRGAQIKVEIRFKSRVDDEVRN